MLPTNRLTREKSPYLLQHAHNPVDWFPWGDEAFEKARREDRPIFLSIGYSTCHWCHVMERESFENVAVAALLNEHFVPVKLDREERPDVDRIYMTAMQLLGLGGGWPLNVFLTPDLKPFYGGTYFPPQSMHGRIGMLELLPSVHAAWRDQRAEVVERGARVLEELTAFTRRSGDTAAERGSLLERCYVSLKRSHDATFGGFGSEPKFPQPVNLTFLFRWFVRDPAGRRPGLDMALRQLDAMRAGGIHDQLGGGFHRYSTDRTWRVPHFEKMLYDQAQLAWSYLAGWQLTGHSQYAATARALFDYVRRDLSSPEGAFYSAEDADSEGEEGRFYVWTQAEIDALLSREDAALWSARYDVSARGNFEHGTSILHEARPLADVARDLRLSLADAEARIVRARAILLEARARRARPHRDDKVLTAWNGLMISAFARGARALGDPALAETARRAAEFLWTRLRDARTGELRRRFRDGDVSAPGQLDDYAFAALGFIDVYRACLDVVWLERAVTLTGVMLERFADDAQGGLFESPAGDPYVPIRMKDDFDGAENSGGSIAALVLLTLGRLLDRADWLERVERTLDLYARRLDRAPIAMPQMLVAMDEASEAPRHVVIVGPRDAEGTRAMVREFDRRFAPDDLLLLVDGEDTRRRLGTLAPFVSPLEERDGRPTAHVCLRYACRLPTTDPRAFRAQLDEFAPTRPITGVTA